MHQADCWHNCSRGKSKSTQQSLTRVEEERLQENKRMSAEWGAAWGRRGQRGGGEGCGGTTWRRLRCIELVGVCRAKQKHIKLSEKNGNQLLFFFSALTSTSPHCTSPNLPHEHPYLWNFLSMLSDLLFSPLSSSVLLSFAFLSSNSASFRPIQCGFTWLWSSSTSKGAHELIKSVGGPDTEGEGE